MNNYEKARLLRVQENKERLRELGVKSVAKSLTSLVESKKKKKKKVNSTDFNMRDDNYSHEMSDDSDKDNPEVATNVQIAKKQHRQRYIAPMSMTKIANMAKQRRVIAPNVLDSNVIKDHHSKETITMGELISSNKGTRKKEVFKKNLANSTCSKHKSNKHLILVDEDDDEDDDEDVDEDDDILQDYVDQDDEYEEMDQIASANTDDETHGDNEYDELEDEDNELLHDELQRLKLEKAIGISKTKKRGPTMLHDVHTRIEDEREVIICNEFGQPVGPEKYDVPDGAKAWVLKSIGQSYKVHKCRFKQKHFYQFKDNKTRWNNRPNNIPEDDFRQLLRLWSNKNVEQRCARAKQSRMSQKNMHTAGPKSFARIHEEMVIFPTLTQLFERTCKRTEGRTYVEIYDDTARKIEQMKNYKAAENESTTIDPFLIVMNKKNYGYRRLYESFKANVDVEKNQLLEMRKEIEDDHERKKAELEAIREDIDTLKPSGNDLLGGSSDGVDEDMLPSFLLCFKPSKSSENGFQVSPMEFLVVMMELTGCASRVGGAPPSELTQVQA
ncbi:hypothetical protein E3N88_23079 [Mikania micrantha]|uniref:Uncharacterized protein n=1 Tax=Mikania micrantha TaxID=192012 RepID=A0A5N6NES6_9ASTR|nr:hypothetical protein E3N88_23079 [Mikania micrantha]